MSGVTGGDDLAHLGRRLREAGDKDLMRELRKGLEAAMRPLGDLIAEGSPAYMPSGYEVTLMEALVSRTSTKTAGRTATVELVTYAQGKRGRRRQIRALNNPGRLRHPVYGRYRRIKRGWLIKNPWAAQNIRGGFFDDPVDANKENIREEARAAVRRVADKIVKE